MKSQIAGRLPSGLQTLDCCKRHTVRSSLPPSMSSSSFTFSNNLVEIGALTALVGSTAAESLVLGNRGTAGVAWAAMSSFGAVSVVKACLSGMCSGWLRETLGIRSIASDHAVGFELPMQSRLAVKARRGIERPVAVFSYSGTKSRRTSVYTTDEFTRIKLRAIPETPPGNPIQIYTQVDYTYGTPNRTLSQLLIHAASLDKLVEVVVLWKFGTKATSVASAIPWAYFCFGALALDIRDSQHRRSSSYGDLDIVAGQLPTGTQPGGSRTIILGTWPDPRTGLVWRVFWGIGALVMMTSIVSTYITLSVASRDAVFVWAAFQVLSLAMRLVMYYVLPSANQVFQPLFRRAFRSGSREREYAEMPAAAKARVVDLALAVGQAQTIGHRRGQEHYAADGFSLAAVQLLKKHTDTYPLSGTTRRHLQISIRAIIGDTALSSAIWMLGTTTVPMGPYYGCIVVLANGPAIPSVRMLNGISLRASMSDAERLHGTRTWWWYWVPCSDGKWLEFCLAGISAVQDADVHDVAVRTDGELDAFLNSGILNSSGLKNLEEVRHSLELARRGRDAFLQLLG
ncbi:hypothetical protein C8F01DRAFT_1105927 [Mycena amicta]|nr:hypothetical protein C8F01DRAFT_1105927 [Mycena amicta]